MAQIESTSTQRGTNKNEELFGEGSAIRDFLPIIKKLIPLPPRKSHGVEDWLSIFTKAFNKETQLAQSTNGIKLRQLAVRMAVSHPRELFETAVWKGKGLISRHDTIIWRAVYNLFGAPWNKQEIKADKKRTANETE